MTLAKTKTKYKNLLIFHGFSKLTKLENVTDFKYLGVLMESSEKNVKVRKAAAWRVYSKLNKIWKSTLLPGRFTQQLFCCYCGVCFALRLRGMYSHPEALRRPWWMLHLTPQDSIYSIQFNSIQFNSIQFNSIQFNSIQSNPIQFKFICLMSTWSNIYNKQRDVWEPTQSIIKDQCRALLLDYFCGDQSMGRGNQTKNKKKNKTWLCPLQGHERS